MEQHAAAASHGAEDIMSMNSSRRHAEGKLKKYQVRLEIRSSNQDILDIMRSDIENTVYFFGQGEFLLGEWDSDHPQNELYCLFFLLSYNNLYK